MRTPFHEALLTLQFYNNKLNLNAKVLALVQSGGRDLTLSHISYSSVISCSSACPAENPPVPESHAEAPYPFRRRKIVPQGQQPRRG